MEDRYYLSKYKYPTRSQVNRWNQYYYAYVNEDIERKQDIYLSFDKVKGKPSDKPKNSSWEQIHFVIKDVFLNYYNLGIKYVHEILLDDRDYYIHKPYSNTYHIAYFSSNMKARKSIVIEVSDSIEYVSVHIKANCGYSSRPTISSKGTPIEKEKFVQFLNCTLQLLYDSDSYAMFIDDYLRKFHALLQEDNSVEGFIISAEKTLSNIVTQLKTRKENLEKMLIESDTYTANERNKIRGEIEGVDYAIKTVIAQI